MIPKAKYRNKVRERLVLAQKLLDKDRLQLIVQLAFLPTEKLQRMMQGERARKKAEPREAGTPTVGQEINNSADHIMMLLHQDVPALLDVFDRLSNAREVDPS